MSRSDILNLLDSQNTILDVDYSYFRAVAEFEQHMAAPWEHRRDRKRKHKPYKIPAPSDNANQKNRQLFPLPRLVASGINSAIKSLQLQTIGF